ncbi:hypothetical protein GCM10027064_17310 [Microbacterium petrolearium]
MSGRRPGLLLRAPRPDDEAEARAAQAELAASGFDFLLAEEGIPWAQYLADVDNERRGIGLAEGRVPATMLFAVADDRIVGRVHIRHALTPSLLRVGGHIGYAVRPGWRNRGYATEMLRQGLAVLRDLGVTRALVTCDDDNVGSIRTIERNGGELEEVFALPGGPLKRRYWIRALGSWSCPTPCSTTRDWLRSTTCSIRIVRTSTRTLPSPTRPARARCSTSAAAPGCLRCCSPSAASR